MNRSRAPYEQHLLTVRVWREWLDAEHSEWRGELKHTGTGEVRYFRTTQGLPDALQTMLDDASAELHGGHAPE
jgi:hypothetical protein